MKKEKKEGGRRKEEDKKLTEGSYLNSILSFMAKIQL
jgi:hypothetical protein